MNISQAEELKSPSLSESGRGVEVSGPSLYTSWAQQPLWIARWLLSAHTLPDCRASPEGWQVPVLGVSRVLVGAWLCFLR